LQPLGRDPHGQTSLHVAEKLETKSLNYSRKNCAEPILRFLKYTKNVMMLSIRRSCPICHYERDPIVNPEGRTRKPLPHDNFAKRRIAGDHDAPLECASRAGSRFKKPRLLPGALNHHESGKAPAMKKTLIVIIWTFFVLCSSMGFAGYVIHLKDGARLLVDQYVEEGDQIRFKRYGGVIGVGKDAILRIEETEVPAEPSAPKDLSEESSPVPSGQKAGGQKGTQKEQLGPDMPKREELEPADSVDKDQKKEHGKTESEKIAGFLEEKRRLDQKINTVYSEYNEAKARGDKESQSELFEKLKSLRNELTQLEREVRAAYGGNIPNWWRENR